MSSPMFDVPKHCAMPVNARGEGPVEDSEAAAYACWCGDDNCTVYPRREVLPPSAYDRMATAPCPAFAWIGQSFAHCDTCGKPFWIHSHVARVRGGPFDGKWWYRVITREDAAACQAKWEGR